MHEHEARLERLEAERRDGAEGRPQAGDPGGRRWSAAGPSRSGEIVVRLEGLAVGYLPGRGAMAPDGSPATRAAGRRARAVPGGPARRADRDRRAERRRQDDAAADDRRRPAAARRRRSRSATPSSSATWRSSAARRSPGATVLDALLEAIPVTAGEARGLPGPVPVPRRRRVQGGPIAVGRRAVAARARAARDPAVEPAPPRRADEPPRHPGARGDRGVHGGLAGDAAGRVARPAAARDGVREAVGGRIEGRRWRSMAGIGSGGQRSRAGGPWQGALEAEAARLRGGRRPARSRAVGSLRRCRLTVATVARPPVAGRRAGDRPHRTTTAARRVRKKDEAVEGGVSAAEGGG